MDELAKLKWQCRRGSRELDLLLTRYLETRYPVADEEEKTHFAEMLKLDDSELLTQHHVYWLESSTRLSTFTALTPS